jgi:hypothetical protein
MTDGRSYPCRLGSTKNILDIYALIKFLETIKEWVEVTFYAGMKFWFMCDI